MENINFYLSFEFVDENRGQRIVIPRPLPFQHHFMSSIGFNDKFINSSEIYKMTQSTLMKWKFSSIRLLASCFYSSESLSQTFEIKFEFIDINHSLEIAEITVLEDEKNYDT